MSNNISQSSPVSFKSFGIKKSALKAINPLNTGFIGKPNGSADSLIIKSDKIGERMIKDNFEKAKVPYIHNAEDVIESGDTVHMQAANPPFGWRSALDLLNGVEKQEAPKKGFSLPWTKAKQPSAEQA